MHAHSGFLSLASLEKQHELGNAHVEGPWQLCCVSPWIEYGLIDTGVGSSLLATLLLQHRTLLHDSNPRHGRSAACFISRLL